MAKIIKFRLVLDVDYIPNGENKDTLKNILFHLPDLVAGKGMLTDSTNAEVDRWSYVVKQRK